MPPPKTVCPSRYSKVQQMLLPRCEGRVVTDTQPSYPTRAPPPPPPNGHHYQSSVSPAVPSVTVACCFLIAGLLLWWLIRRCQRSRRHLILLAKLGLVRRPELVEVTLLPPQLYAMPADGSWERLSPLAVAVPLTGVGERRARRGRPHSTLYRGLVPKQSSGRAEKRPAWASRPPRDPHPAHSLHVAVLIAMPSPRVASGNLAADGWTGSVLPSGLSIGIADAQYSH